MKIVLLKRKGSIMRSKAKRLNFKLDFAYAKYLAIALYIALSLLFIAYFVVLNNDSFILYSFAAFVALGFVLALFSNWQAHALSVALVLIAASSLAYAGIYSSIAAYSLAALAVLSFAVMFVQVRKYALYLLWALALPILFYVEKINAALVINVAIIGYYLLISVVIALFANMVAAGNSLHIGSRLHASIMRHRNGIYALALALALFIFFMPFWPSGYHIVINTLPYANISIQQHGALYAISFNASKYQGIENSSMGNIRVLAGNRFLKAYVWRKATFADNNVTIIFNGSKGIDSARIYFMPTALNETEQTEARISSISFYNAYNSSLIRVNSSVFHALYANSTKLPGGIASIENIGKGIKNETVTYTLLQKESNAFNETVPITPYYMMQGACSMGNDSAINISVRSNGSISAFMMGSFSNMTNATSANASGAPSGYSQFLSRCMKSSYRHMLNSTNITISESLKGCTYYIITSPVPVKIALKENQTYYSYIQNTKTMEVPYVFYTGGLKGESSFLSGSLVYLANKYESELSNNSAS